MRSVPNLPTQQPLIDHLIGKMPLPAKWHWLVGLGESPNTAFFNPKISFSVGNVYSGLSMGLELIATRYSGLYSIFN